MTDTSHLNLKQPDPIDWENYNPGGGGKYRRPPVPVDASGKALVFNVQLPTKVVRDTNDEDYRTYQLGPLTIVKNPDSQVNGTEIRFFTASTKGFTKADGTLTNANMAGNVLRAVGISAKPQTVAEYDAAMDKAAGRVAEVTLDWEARSSETGERIRGYANFPDDPERPGQKKAILNQGDTYTVRDRKGNVIETKTVEAEVMFANPRVRYFIDPARKKSNGAG